jgi:soluble lytic murein transglycosylase-like protein
MGATARAMHAQAMTAADDGLAAVEPAPSVTVATANDSVATITELLVANGAPRERAAPVAAAVLKYSARESVDPLLVVGIIGVENAELRDRARSSKGATGVMQVMPGWKREIHDCGEDLHDVDVNVCFGTRILRQALDEAPTVSRALRLYNGCRRGPRCERYAGAVFHRAGRAILLSRARKEEGR